MKTTISVCLIGFENRSHTEWRFKLNLITSSRGPPSWSWLADIQNLYSPAAIVSDFIPESTSLLDFLLKLHFWDIAADVGSRETGTPPVQTSGTTHFPPSCQRSYWLRAKCILGRVQTGWVSRPRSTLAVALLANSCSRLPTISQLFADSQSAVVDSYIPRVDRHIPGQGNYWWRDL